MDEDFLTKIQSHNEEQLRQQERQEELGKFDELGNRLENAKAPVVQVDGTDLAGKITELKDYLGQVFQVLAQSSQDTTLVELLNEQFVQLINELTSAQSGRDAALQRSLTTFAKSVQDINFSPTIETPKLDTKPLVKVIEGLKKSLKAPDVDLREVVDGLKSVRKAINSQQFPVPNYILPFKDSDGKATQVQLTSLGVPVDIQDASVTIDTTGLATSSKQDTQTSELQDIEADVEATNTRLGEVQASPTANTVLARLKTIGDKDFATTAKQDSLLTELQLKADLTETQPVSLASVPSHAVTNAGTFAVQAAQSGAWNITNISGTISLPTGAATSAKQDNIIGHIDGIEGLLAGTLDVDTGLTQPTTPADTQPVSGTFWQATQPVSNAGLTELAAAINSDKVDINISSGNITGFATSAKQDTAQTALDAIKTATETIDNAIAGSEMQVDVLTMPTTTVQATNLDIRDLTFAADKVDASGTVLGASSNAIGKLAANSGVDIGDVDVTSIAAGTNIIGGVNPTPSGAAAQALSNDTSAAYEASSVTKAAAGTVYGVTGYNSRTSSQFFQFYNSATVPADTAVPVITITVPASSNFSIDFGVYGRRFSTGISWANSSTGPTKTVGSADMFVDVNYV